MSLVKVELGGLCCASKERCLLADAFVIILSLATSIVCCIIVVNSSNEDANGKAGPTNKIAGSGYLACWDCKKFPAGQEALAGMAVSVHSRTESCCASNMEQLFLMLQLLTTDKAGFSADIANASKISSTRQTSAHARFLPAVHSSGNTDLPYFRADSNVSLQLDTTRHDTVVEHSSNVEVLLSGLRVVRSGVYYVYSNINWAPASDRPCREFLQKTWHHGVVRTSSNPDRKSELLVRSVHTCSDVVRDNDNSYAAGVFELTAGDHLHVEVPGYGLINVDSSYVGVLMLGETD